MMGWGGERGWIAGGADGGFAPIVAIQQSRPSPPKWPLTTAIGWPEWVESGSNVTTDARKLSYFENTINRTL